MSKILVIIFSVFLMSCNSGSEDSGLHFSFKVFENNTLKTEPFVNFHLDSSIEVLDSSNNSFQWEKMNIEYVCTSPVVVSGLKTINYQKRIRLMDHLPNEVFLQQNINLKCSLYFKMLYKGDYEYHFRERNIIFNTSSIHDKVSFVTDLKNPMKIVSDNNLFNLRLICESKKWQPKFGEANISAMKNEILQNELIDMFVNHQQKKCRFIDSSQEKLKISSLYIYLEDKLIWEKSIKLLSKEIIASDKGIFINNDKDYQLVRLSLGKFVNPYPVSININFNKNLVLYPDQNIYQNSIIKKYEFYDAFGKLNELNISEKGSREIFVNLYFDKNLKLLNNWSFSFLINYSVNVKQGEDELVLINNEQISSDFKL